VIAKGAKRPTSQLRPVLLPFQPVQALLGKTPTDENSEVHVLRSAEWAGGQPLLSAAAMFSGFYLNELLLKLLARQDPHPALFDAYADTLAAVATALTGVEEAAALRAFELTLLRELGWLPELSRITLTAQALQAEQPYTLHTETGITPAAGGVEGAMWLALEAALADANHRALRALCALQATALRVPLRNLLHYHLGPAPLRTRQVWQGVQKLAHNPNTSP
jgi:DNA repair protein RecO (recombination protein O)